VVLGRRPLGAILHSSNEPGELSQWLCHDDSTINIVVLIIIIIIIIVSQTVETIRTKLGTRIHLEPRFALGKSRSRSQRRRRKNGGAVGVQREGHRWRHCCRCVTERGLSRSRSEHHRHQNGGAVVARSDGDGANAVCMSIEAPLSCNLIFALFEWMGRRLSWPELTAGYQLAVERVRVEPTVRVRYLTTRPTTYDIQQ